MNCPNCGLMNPPAAQRCDCGYDFQTGCVVEKTPINVRCAVTEKRLLLGHIGFWLLTVLSFVVERLLEVGNSTEARGETSIGASIVWCYIAVGIALLTVPFTVYAVTARKRVRLIYFLLGLAPVTVFTASILLVIVVVFYENAHIGGF